MPTESDFFSADQAEIWVQPGGPNTTVYLLPCANSDAIDAHKIAKLDRLKKRIEGGEV